MLRALHLPLPRRPSFIAVDVLPDGLTTSRLGVAGLEKMLKEKFSYMKGGLEDGDKV